ncbi:MAG: Ku protein [Bryobacteraceae bacterium]|nr:Ku protein [Bryobacteraceae bacterium]
MATAIWKGFLTFGLVSIPIKMFRAARPEKVSFRQLQAGTGARVRQSLVVSPGSAPAAPGSDKDLDEDEEERESPLPAREVAQAAGSSRTSPFVVPSPAPPSPALAAATLPAISQPREIPRSEIVKGYEYARDQYVEITKEELALLTPQTAREMQIVEFVKLSEVDPIYFETSYYSAPDKGGEKAYSLLFEALRKSGFVGLAQVAMHNREHVVVIRPGRHGIILHTMFYESEIRETDEFRADVSGVNEKELKLALLLVENLEAPFRPSNYHDSYKAKLDALIQSKIAGEETIAAPAPKAAPVVNILEALQKSLEAASRKPPVKEDRPAVSASAPASAAAPAAAKKRKKA